MFKAILKIYKHKNSLSSNYRISALDERTWEGYFCLVAKSNLLQSWFYGEAKIKEEKWSATRYMILKGNIPIALLQVLRKSFFLGLFSIIRINRGPLWLKQPDGMEEVKQIYALLSQQYSLLKRQIMLIAPELENTSENQFLLSQLNFRRRRKHSSTSSIWVDLSQSEIELRKNLKANWRNQLKWAETKGLSLKEISSPADCDHFLEAYKEFQNQKNFIGISSKIVKHLFQKNSNFSGYLLQAFFEDKSIAGIIVVRHGLACTYLIGLRFDPDKQNWNAMNFLLWNTMLYMKQNGCLWFDLGGVTESSIGRFKKGVGGKEYQLLSEYMLF